MVYCLNNSSCPKGVRLCRLNCTKLPKTEEIIIENHKISELCEFLNYDSSCDLLKILDDQQAQELRRIGMKSFTIIYTEL